jgi:hypothetical protein
MLSSNPQQSSTLTQDHQSPPLSPQISSNPLTPSSQLFLPHSAIQPSFSFPENLHSLEIRLQKGRGETDAHSKEKRKTIGEVERCESGDGEIGGRRESESEDLSEEKSENAIHSRGRKRLKLISCEREEKEKGEDENKVENEQETEKEKVKDEGREKEEEKENKQHEEKEKERDSSVETDKETEERKEERIVIEIWEDEEQNENQMEGIVMKKEKQKVKKPENLRKGRKEKKKDSKPDPQHDDEILMEKEIKQSKKKPDESNEEIEEMYEKKIGMEKGRVRVYKEKEMRALFSLNYSLTISQPLTIKNERGEELTVVLKCFCLEGIHGNDKISGVFSLPKYSVTPFLVCDPNWEIVFSLFLFSTLFVCPSFSFEC